MPHSCLTCREQPDHYGPDETLRRSGAAILPAVVRRTKSEYDRLDVPPTLSDMHGQLYGSVSSLKRVRCIEAAVA